MIHFRGGQLLKDNAGIPNVLNAGGDGGAAYVQRLIDTYGADEVWRLTDIESGTNIPASVLAARNGTLVGWTLQDVVSPVSGDPLKAPTSDALNDYGNILTSNGSTGLVDIFNPLAFSINMWVKRTTDWSGVFDVAFLLLSDANNQIFFRSAGGSAVYGYTAGGTGTQRGFVTTTTAWSMLTMTVDVVSDEMKTYFNGANPDTQNGLGAWVGALTRALIGAQTTGPANVWDGQFAFPTIKFGLPVWTAGQVAAIYADAL